jgi:hypothetical protein
MSKKIDVANQLRTQIEAAAEQKYPLKAVEMKIAAALLQDGRFEGHLSEEELTSVIRNVVYSRFANQRIAGRDIALVHNIVSIQVKLVEHEVRIGFLVHIHKPIVAFLRFRYTLIDDESPGRNRIILKRGSLKIRKDTRRFDMKSKAALASIDVENIARKELADLCGILKTTFQVQLEEAGIVGEIGDIQLSVGEGCLEVCLEADVRAKQALTPIS